MEGLDWKVVGILATLFVAWNGFLVSVIWWLINRAAKGGDDRVRRLERSIEQEGEKRQDLEREFRQLIADLPLKYVQREDWIRLATTVEAKLDALAQRVDGLKDKMLVNKG